jgi:hypothetical protein
VKKEYSFDLEKYAASIEAPCSKLQGIFDCKEF